MVFKNICVLVFWMKVASALEGLNSFRSWPLVVFSEIIVCGATNVPFWNLIEITFSIPGSDPDYTCKPIQNANFEGGRGGGGGRLAVLMMAEWSKALPINVLCLSTLPGFVHRACDKVTSDLGLGGYFRRVRIFRFPSFIPTG